MSFKDRVQFSLIFSRDRTIDTGTRTKWISNGAVQEAGKQRG